MDLVTVINPKPQNEFVEIPYITSITERGLRYIKKGFPIHLSGPTGCKKTTLVDLLDRIPAKVHGPGSPCRKGRTGLTVN